MASVVLTMADDYPSLFPTPEPSSVPSPAPTARMCSFTYLECGATVAGDNTNFGSFVGGPSPEVRSSLGLELP